MNFKVGDKVKFKGYTGYSFYNIKKARGIITGIVDDKLYIDIINDNAFDKGWKSTLQPFVGYCFKKSKNIIKVKPWWRFWND